MNNGNTTIYATIIFIIFIVGSGGFILFSLILAIYQYYKNNSTDIPDPDAEPVINTDYDPNAVLEKVIPGEVIKEASSSKPVVILFEETKYKNPLIKLNAGKYSFEGSLKGLNDTVESIAVADGYTVYLFKNVDYDNPKVKLTKSVPDLGDYNNNISSILISKK